MDRFSLESIADVHLAGQVVSQKEILASNYGLKDLEAVEKVKAVYQELEIAQMYHSFEEDSYSDLQDKISKIEALNPQVFHNFLSRIYKREQ